STRGSTAPSPTRPTTSAGPKPRPGCPGAATTSSPRSSGSTPSSRRWSRATGSSWGRSCGLPTSAFATTSRSPRRPWTRSSNRPGPLPAARGRWVGLWPWLGEDEAEGLHAGRGEGWEPITVPEQQAACAGRSALWYRTRFPRPDHNGRVLLRVGGALLATNVWLNGRLLGSHYGYFGPFGFDVTSHLREQNLLVICCESPIETDLSRKRHVMGIFNDGDSRPYPGSAWFSLPEPYRWEVPVGLWMPVELEYLGAVSLDWVRLP